MTDKEKIELGIRAVKAFKDLFPELWEHNRDYLHCTKCDAVFEDINDYSESGNPIYVFRSGSTDCTIPDPLPITWDNAMKLRDAACNSHAWNDACYKVWMDVTGKAVTYHNFWRSFAKKEHYILAACIAQERE